MFSRELEMCDRRRALANWLVAMGGLMSLLASLMIYIAATTGRAEELLAIATIVITYATTPFWAAVRVRQGSGITITRYLLLALIPFALGEAASPLFVIATLSKHETPRNLPAGIVLLVLCICHLCSYIGTARQFFQIAK